MSKCKKVYKAMREEGFMAAKNMAESLGLGFYPSQYPGHFELWSVRDGRWILQIGYW